jgi:hypothetical protein
MAVDRWIEAQSIQGKRDERVEVEGHAMTMDETIQQGAENVTDREHCRWMSGGNAANA